MLLLRQGIVLVSLIQHAVSQNWDGPPLYPGGIAPDTIVAEGWNSSYPGFESTDSSYLPLVDGTDGVDTSEADSDLATRDAKDFYLRILPLGASIVQGVESSDKTGFRKLLRQQLRWKGWKVNMVGTKNDGDNFNDNDNEGHPGWIIDQIHEEWSKSSVNELKPNLVLINGGTNDCGNDVDVGNAGTRMKSLIDDIYSKLPDVTIVLSTLVKSRNHRACAEDLSQQFRDLVKNEYRDKRMGLADIDSVIQTSQLASDGIHPNDDGYKLFAAVWWNAISKLEDVIQPPPTDGLIKDDSATGGADKCKKVAGNASGPVQTQKGSGHDDGNYKHDRIAKGAIESARIQKAGDPRTITQDIPLYTFFADIIKNDPNSDRSLSLDDWIRIRIDLEGKVWYWFRQNLGGGKFGPSKSFDPGMSCPEGSGYAFGDFNNDGLDDFFCIKDGASVSVSLNRGGSPPKLESIGVVVPSSSGWTIADVHIADIDGDGRADFCLYGVDGKIKCSRNAGQGDKYSWQGFSTVDGIRGVVFDKGQPNERPVLHFGDINGDYRDDILMVGQNGNVQTYTNRRGRGSGIVPDWVSLGITHEGQPDQYIRNQIKFGKIYGSNRLDYIYIKEEDDYFDVLVWENKGSGGTKLKADGTFYCDMRGTGSDDYVWIYADGHSNEIFANTHNPPFWDPNYSFTLNVGAPRTLIHLADWTGNGRCDVLVQDKATSAVTLWENQWNAGTKTLAFANRGVVASPGCGKATGVGIFDRVMRIADMDGDGRADIVCFELEGRLTSWLNTKDGMKDVGQIKLTESWDRANLRLADVENTGRADIIWLNKYTGAGSVWKNNGYAGPNGGGGGSSFSWTKRGVLYSPIDRGEVMNFANLGGRGRADLIQVYPTTNEAYTFFNKCPGGGAGGDDGDITDPKLPQIDDHETPRGDGDGFPTAEHWLALGDSYSAGVGAGKLANNPRDPDSNCFTSTGSYPKRLELRYKMLNQGLEFLSCSGDVMSNINDAGSYGRDSQLDIMRSIPKSSYKMATLSIGGNDLGFADIVKSCIILGSFISGTDCETALKKAESIAGISPRDSASHAEVLADLAKTYRNILDAAGDGFSLAVTGYARFFAVPEGNTDCNNGQMQLAAIQDLPGQSETRPSLPLTVELRSRINRGVDGFNIMIRAAISEVQQGLKNDGITSKRIGFVDINPVFEGHRFCEKGDSSESGWPEFTNRAWFFSSPFRSDILPDGQQVAPRGNDGSPRLQIDRRGDGAFCSSPNNQWDCAFAELQARDPNMPLNEKEYPQGRDLSDIIPDTTKAMAMKAFHPKTIAYDAISKLIAVEFGEPVGQDPQEPQVPQDPQDPTDTADYYIWPEDGRDAKQVEEIASNLQRYVTRNNDVQASDTKTFGLNYWRFPSLTAKEANEIANLTNVASVNVDCGFDCPDDPTTETVYQDEAPQQLRYISNKPGTSQDSDRYYFDRSGGKGIKVYVVDTGANMKHREFDRIRDRTRWLQVGKGNEAGEDDCKAHGTSMLSLVAGTTLGVAKNIDPIIVRMPCRVDPKNPNSKAAMKPIDWIDGLGMVNDELDGSSPTVVLMASYWTENKFFKGPDGEVNWFGFTVRHMDLLESLASKGAILVTGTGNEQVASITGVPASFGKPGLDAFYVPSLLVMGGISPDGTIAFGNTDFDAGLPHAYAPGTSIRAADSNEAFWPDFDVKNTQGTSCSAAFTAGLAAYLLRMAQLGATIDGQAVRTDPQSMKDFIVERSWSRQDAFGRSRPGIWNMVDVYEQRNTKREGEVDVLQL